MKKSKVKNRKRKALRNGRNNGGFSSQDTDELIIECIDHFLEVNMEVVLKAANHFYEVGGRGCVNISLIDTPDCPFKAGEIRFVSEESNNEMLLSCNTDWNIQLSEEISAYEPKTQAVVCVWYGRRHFTTVLTDRYAALSATINHQSLTIH